MFGRHIIKMYLRHRLTKTFILRRISLVTSHVSHPYKSTDFTQALKILILVSFHIDVDSHTFLSLQNDPLAFFIRCTNFSNLFLEQNSTCFGQFLCPSSGVFHCTHSNKYMSKPVWHIHIAVCTVPDSWWWTEELSETCRVLFKK